MGRRSPRLPVTARRANLCQRWGKGWRHPHRTVRSHGRIGCAKHERELLDLPPNLGERCDPALHEASRTVKGRAEQIRAAVEAKARELQLDVRAGMFEP
jgi:hypothetical protein